MTLGNRVAGNLQVMDELDASKLDALDQHARAARKVAADCSLILAAAERTARTKLREVQIGMSPSTARTKAWAGTRPLRAAVSAMRRVSAELTTYHVGLGREFFEPARKAAAKKKGRHRPGVGKSTGGGFDILGGVK